MLLRSILLALSTQKRLGDAMERSTLSRRLVRRFVAGRTLADALAVVQTTNARGFPAALTYLGENVVTPADATRAADMYLEILDERKRQSLQATPSLKLTHLGLDLSRELCLANLRRVLERAQATDTLVWIDMESSRYTTETLDLYASLRQEFATVGCVIQAALRRSAADLERVIELGATVRLCKGAYREPPDVAFTVKREVDENYSCLMDRLLSADAQARSVYPAFATHDETLIERAGSLAQRRGIDPVGYEIQMLYGVRPELHTEVRRRGLRLRVLVPFGEAWYGYFVRRLAERPANLLFFLRQLIPTR